MQRARDVDVQVESARTSPDHRRCWPLCREGMRRAALFLDRDGTVTRPLGRGEYVLDAEALQLAPGAREALAWARSVGWILVIVTNQRCISGGQLSTENLSAIHGVMQGLLGEHAAVDAIFTCPHGPSDDCPCRKPRPGLLIEAARQLDLDLASSIMVGDEARDLEAGRAAGTVIQKRVDHRPWSLWHTVRCLQPPIGQDQLAYGRSREAG